MVRRIRGRARVNEEFKTYYRAQTHEMVDELLDLEERTHPDTSDAQEVEKHRQAVYASVMAGRLVKRLTGWAVNHLVGLAASDENPHGLWFNEDLKKETPHSERFEFLNSHDHERRGSRFLDDLEHDFANGDPAVYRQALRNLRLPGYPVLIEEAILDELEGLRWGEAPKIFARETTNLKPGARETWKLRLFALEYIEHWEARGFKRFVAENKIVKFYGLGYNGVDKIRKKWPKGAGTNFGDLYVEDALAIAKWRGWARDEAETRAVANDESARNYADEIFGHDVAREYGQKYQSLVGKEGSDF